MTPEQALKILDIACSQAIMNRGNHIQVIEAIRILDAFIRKAEVDEGEEKEE